MWVEAWSGERASGAVEAMLQFTILALAPSASQASPEQVRDIEAPKSNSQSSGDR